VSSFYWRYPGKSPTAKPPAVEDRFQMKLKPKGGRYTPPASLAAHYLGKDFVCFGAVEITEGTKGAIKLPVGKAPVYDKALNVFIYDPANFFRATLTANAKTGVFSGKLSDYDEYTDGKGVSKLKTTSLSHAGVLLQIIGTYSGKGYVLIPDPYVDPANPKANYALKRSYPVSIH